MVSIKIMWCNACNDARISYEPENENQYCSVCSDKLNQIGWMESNA